MDTKEAPPSYSLLDRLFKHEPPMEDMSEAEIAALMQNIPKLKKLAKLYVDHCPWRNEFLGTLLLRYGTREVIMDLWCDPTFKVKCYHKDFYDVNTRLPGIVADILLKDNTTFLSQSIYQCFFETSNAGQIQAFLHKNKGPLRLSALFALQLNKVVPPDDMVELIKSVSVKIVS